MKILEVIYPDNPIHFIKAMGITRDRWKVISKRMAEKQSLYRRIYLLHGKSTPILVMVKDLEEICGHPNELVVSAYYLSLLLSEMSISSERPRILQEYHNYVENSLVGLWEELDSLEQKFTHDKLHYPRD